MILMKTKGTTFANIWESDGTAPFNSTYVGSEILNYSDKVPIRAIGFYSGEQSNKNISLLKIQHIQQVFESPNDIQLHFKFTNKLQILSSDFDIEVSKLSSKLLLIINDSKVYNILNKFGVIPAGEKIETIQSPKFYKKNILVPNFILIRTG